MRFARTFSAMALFLLTSWTAAAAASGAVPLADAGSIIAGGCDNAAAGADTISGPLWNGGRNEFYTKYMDGGEYSSYTLLFRNLGAALTDVTVRLTFSGAAAAKMTVFNSPVYVGRVAPGATAGAVFQLGTDVTTAGLDSANLDFDVTSPADGYSAPLRITHAQLLQANDVVTRLSRCSTFTTQSAFGTWYESPVGGHPLNSWRWSGSASSPGTVGSETALDGICGDSTPNTAAMTGNSGTTSGNNFNGNADSFLLQRFQPTLVGLGPSGQPYHYAWKWHSFYHSSETPGAATGAWGAFYNDHWDQPINPTGDQAAAFPVSVSYFLQTVFDNGSPWNWGPGNQFLVSFLNVRGLATVDTWFAYGHEHADVTIFGGVSSATSRRDIALDDDNLVYDEYFADAQSSASCGAEGPIGQLAFDLYRYANCPSSTAHLSVVDGNAAGPLLVTVTSPGTGDSESVVLAGNGPYFSGSIVISTQAGQGTGDGALFVLPSEEVVAIYTDVAPPGTTQASAWKGLAAPGEASGLTVSKVGSAAVIHWTPAAGAAWSDIVRGALSALPVGPGGADETCFEDVSGASLTDADVPSAGEGYWYLVRGEAACGAGTWGDREEGVDTVERTSATCL